MYCKKCGYKLEEDAKVCPFCNHKVDEEIVKYEEKQIVKEETIGNNDNGLVNYEKIDNEAAMSDVRTSLGYVNLKTKFWHHVLIACGGYLLMNLIFSVVGSAILSGYMNKGYNFDCIMHATTTSEMYACPIEQLSPYLFVSSIGQVIGELGIVLVVLLIFIKYLKTFVSEIKDRETWKWFGIGLAIMYGGNYLYNIILTLLELNSTSSNQDAVNEMIFNNPVLGFLFVVVAAPIFEEIIFRFGVFRAFTGKGKKLEIVGIVVTTILFAGIHMVSTFEEAFAVPGSPNYELLKSDLLSLPVYLIGAFGLTFAYYKSKNFMTPIVMHMTYNCLSFIAIMSLGNMDLEGVEAIVRFLPLLI